jgi:hypothetical protein
MRDFITIVSGLPRSGTSMMMQMLQAGGIAALTDQLRTSDEDNPRGYFEFEQVKHLKTDRSWLPNAVGKAIKIIHLLLMDLPCDFQYRVIMMNRDLGEVAQSQSIMLQRSGKTGASLSPERLAAIYASQLTTVRKWLAERNCFKVLEVQYASLVRDPQSNAASIAAFLGGGLDIEAMAGAVDPNLYRNRSATG